MIELVDVTKSYPSKGGRKTVLDGVDMVFPRGRNSAIVGPNGAGKSTLMRILSGAELPDSGTVERHAHVSWPLGFAGGLHGALTGRENVAFIARIYGCDLEETYDYVADFAQIGRNMDNLVRTYSSGMRARLAFGMSMAIRFDYYLIDEVIAVGDTSFKNKCKRVLQDRMMDATVIMISHAPGTMREFCEHGCVLENGQLLDFPDIDSALDYYDASLAAQ